MDNINTVAFSLTSALVVPRRAGAKAVATPTRPAATPAALSRAQRRAQLINYGRFVERLGESVPLAPVSETEEGYLVCEWDDKMGHKLRTIREYELFLRSDKDHARFTDVTVYMTADGNLVCDYPRRSLL